MNYSGYFIFMILNTGILFFFRFDFDFGNYIFGFYSDFCFSDNSFNFNIDFVLFRFKFFYNFDFDTELLPVFKIGFKSCFCILPHVFLCFSAYCIINHIIHQLYANLRLHSMTFNEPLVLGQGKIKTIFLKYVESVTTTYEVNSQEP